MNVKQQVAVLGGDLGKTSKMPSFSFGLDTGACKTGSKLAEVCGSVCEGCYARRLENFRPSVKQGHMNRTAKVQDAMKTKEGRAEWVAAMVARLSKKLDMTEPYFRWHDSGDVQGLQHLRMIADVARALPDVNFWLPTKEKQTVIKFTEDEGVPSNLMIRVSSGMVDGKPLARFPFTSTVHKADVPAGHVCPAPKQDGECGTCRACWSHDVTNISYHKH